MGFGQGKRSHQRLISKGRLRPAVWCEQFTKARQQPGRKSRKCRCYITHVVQPCGLAKRTTDWPRRHRTRRNRARYLRPQRDNSTEEAMDGVTVAVGLVFVLLAVNLVLFCGGGEDV